MPEGWVVFEHVNLSFAKGTLVPKCLAPVVSAKRSRRLGLPRVSQTPAVPKRQCATRESGEHDDKVMWLPSMYTRLGQLGARASTGARYDEDVRVAAAGWAPAVPAAATCAKFGSRLSSDLASLSDVLVSDSLKDEGGEDEGGFWSLGSGTPPATDATEDNSVLVMPAAAAMAGDDDSKPFDSSCSVSVLSSCRSSPLSSPLSSSFPSSTSTCLGPSASASCCGESHFWMPFPATGSGGGVPASMEASSASTQAQAEVDAGGARGVTAAAMLQWARCQRVAAKAGQRTRARGAARATTNVQLGQPCAVPMAMPLTALRPAAEPEPNLFDGPAWPPRESSAHESWPHMCRRENDPRCVSLCDLLYDISSHSAASLPLNAPILDSGRARVEPPQGWAPTSSAHSGGQPPSQMPQMLAPQFCVAANGTAAGAAHMPHAVHAVSAMQPAYATASMHAPHATAAMHAPHATAAMRAPHASGAAQAPHTIVAAASSQPSVPQVMGAAMCGYHPILPPPDPAPFCLNPMPTTAAGGRDANATPCNLAPPSYPTPLSTAAPPNAVAVDPGSVCLATAATYATHMRNPTVHVACHTAPESVHNRIAVAAHGVPYALPGQSQIFHPVCQAASLPAPGSWATPLNQTPFSQTPSTQMWGGGGVPPSAPPSPPAKPTPAKPTLASPPPADPSSAAKRAPAHRPPKRGPGLRSSTSILRERPLSRRLASARADSGCNRLVRSVRCLVSLRAAGVVVSSFPPLAFAACFLAAGVSSTFMRTIPLGPLGAHVEVQLGVSGHVLMAALAPVLAIFIALIPRPCTEPADSWLIPHRAAPLPLTLVYLMIATGSVLSSLRAVDSWQLAHAVSTPLVQSRQLCVALGCSLDSATKLGVLLQYLSRSGSCATADSGVWQSLRFALVATGAIFSATSVAMRAAGEDAITSSCYPPGNLRPSITLQEPCVNACTFRDSLMLMGVVTLIGIIFTPEVGKRMLCFLGCEGPGVAPTLRPLPKASEMGGSRSRGEEDGGRVAQVQVAGRAAAHGSTAAGRAVALASTS